MSPNNRRRYKPRRRARRRSLTALSIAAIIIIAAAAAIYSYAKTARQQTAALPDTEAAALLQVVTPGDTPEQIKHYTGFTVSFNAECHVPNYVAWELTADKARGRLPRKSDFRADPDIDGCATLEDYRRSGYDRGHMAPAADMKWSAAAMSDCHYLSNIAPQAQPLNTGAWATLEENCRSWAIRDSAIYVVCGPILTDIAMRHIGKSGVSVPQRYFKVVIAPYANPPRGIGFIMPNRRVAGGVQATATTIDHIEAITGYDFFAALPDEIETTIESQSNYPLWQRKI